MFTFRKPAVKSLADIQKENASWLQNYIDQLQQLTDDTASCEELQKVFDSDDAKAHEFSEKLNGSNRETYREMLEKHNKWQFNAAKKWLGLYIAQLNHQTSKAFDNQAIYAVKLFEQDNLARYRKYHGMVSSDGEFHLVITTQFRAWKVSTAKKWLHAYFDELQAQLINAESYPDIQLTINDEYTEKYQENIQIIHSNLEMLRSFLAEYSSQLTREEITEANSYLEADVEFIKNIEEKYSSWMAAAAAKWLRSYITQLLILIKNVKHPIHVLEIDFITRHNQEVYNKQIINKINFINQIKDNSNKLINDNSINQIKETYSEILSQLNEFKKTMSLSVNAFGEPVVVMQNDFLAGQFKAKLIAHLDLYKQTEEITACGLTRAEELSQKLFEHDSLDMQFNVLAEFIKNGKTQIDATSFGIFFSFYQASGIGRHSLRGILIDGFLDTSAYKDRDTHIAEILKSSVNKIKFGLYANFLLNPYHKYEMKPPAYISDYQFTRNKLQ